MLNAAVAGRLPAMRPLFFTYFVLTGARRLRKPSSQGRISSTTGLLGEGGGRVEVGAEEPQARKQARFLRRSERSLLPKILVLFGPLTWLKNGTNGGRSQPGNMIGDGRKQTDWVGDWGQPGQAWDRYAILDGQVSKAELGSKAVTEVETHEQEEHNTASKKKSKKTAAPTGDKNLELNNKKAKSSKQEEEPSKKRKVEPETPDRKLNKTIYPPKKSKRDH